MTATERAAQAQAGFVRVRWAENDLEIIARCAVCGAVLEPNERQCPLCDGDAARDEVTWYRGVQ
jgi:rubrerythrin